MPQLTQRAGSTSASSSARPSVRATMVMAVNGQSMLHWVHPVQRWGSTVEVGLAWAPRGRVTHGTTSSPPTIRTPINHATPGGSCRARGSQNANHQSTGTDSGRTNGFPSGAMASGQSTATAVSMPMRDQVSGRGGISTGRASRDTCSRSSTPMPSGSATWANRLRKKKALGGFCSATKVRPTGSLRIGRASKSRAPAMASSRPKLSQTITNPVQALKRKMPRRSTPEVQARTRGPKVRRWDTIRATWTMIARTARSEA